MKRKRHLAALFGTGWIQVFLVAANTWQIAHERYIGAMLVGFGISLVWSLNVKSIAFGGWRDRIAYASGAAVGTVSGLWFIKSICG